MRLQHALLAALLTTGGLAAVPLAQAQGVIASVTNDRTPTFTPAGSPGPVIDGRMLIGRPARPEGPFGLIGVDTTLGHVLVRRSAIMIAPVNQPGQIVCDTLKNLQPGSRNYGSNGFGADQCPTRR